MSFWKRFRAWVSDARWNWPGPASPAELHEIYLRRFAGRNEARFVELWNELALILNTSPLTLDEKSRIEDLLNAAAERTGDKPGGILEDVLAFAVDNSSGEPGPDWTVGGLVEWLLASSEPAVGVRHGAEQAQGGTDAAQHVERASHRPNGE